MTASSSTAPSSCGGGGGGGRFSPSEGFDEHESFDQEVSCSYMEGEDDDGEGCESYGELAWEKHASGRVDHIIAKATDQLIEAAGVFDSSYDQALSPSPTAPSPGLHTGDSSTSSALKKEESKPSQHRQTLLMGTGGKPDPSRGIEISSIISAGRQSRDVNQYLDRRSYGKTPSYLHRVMSNIDAEQRYIMGLHAFREDEDSNEPRACFRVLTSGEKQELVSGLKQEFQQATAKLLKAGKKCAQKADLETELVRIKKDIDDMSQPYIFVKAES